MKTASLARLGAWLAGVWAGLMAGIGFVAAPLLFANLPRADAGRLVSVMFSTDATIGVCAGGLLTMIGLQLARDRAERGAGSRFGVELVLALAALLCIVVGYYALQPMVEDARSGRGSLSFGALHAITSSFFVVRLVLAAVLAWLLAKPRG